MLTAGKELGIVDNSSPDGVSPEGVDVPVLSKVVEVSPSTKDAIDQMTSIAIRPVSPTTSMVKSITAPKAGDGLFGVRDTKGVAPEVGSLVGRHSKKRGEWWMCVWWVV